ncbi:MAG: hypothetical protein U1A27_14095 [Phycisphaerae bacterium]
MKRLSAVLVLACVCSLAVSSVQAGEGCCMKNGDAKTVKASGQCTKTGMACAAFGKEFPAMTVTVGDQKYCWATQSAECWKAMQASKAKPSFMVAGKQFDDMEKAMDAFVCAAECYKAGFTTIAYEEKDGAWAMCEMGDDCCTKGAAEGKACCAAKKASTLASCPAGKKDAAVASAKSEGCAGSKEHGAAKVDYKQYKKFRVAGHTYTSFADAMAAHKRVAESMKQVKMSYIVDGKTVDNSDEVCPMAKKDHKVVYCVGGSKTPCEMTAKVLMAKAQCDAAAKALDTSTARL